MQLCIIVRINSVVRTVRAPHPAFPVNFRHGCATHVALARFSDRDAWPHYHNASIDDRRCERETRVDLWPKQD